MTRTFVTFRSQAFNTSQPQPEYINPECYGDDLARWLAAELKKRGIETEEPGQEDFGWYLPFCLGDQTFDFIVSYRPDDAEGDWMCGIERRAPLLGALLGGRSKSIPQEVPQRIHAILAGNSNIRDVRWHYKKDFDKGREDEGSPKP